LAHISGVNVTPIALLVVEVRSEVCRTICNTYELYYDTKRQALLNTTSTKFFFEKFPFLTTFRKHQKVQFQSDRDKQKRENEKEDREDRE